MLANLEQNNRLLNNPSTKIDDSKTSKISFIFVSVRKSSGCSFAASKVLLWRSSSGLGQRILFEVGRVHSRDYFVQLLLD